MPLPRAIEHVAGDAWPKDSAAGHVTLAFDDRFRRRFRVALDSGEDILLDLPRASALAEGDGLLLDDGRWIGVRAAPEPVADITCADALRLMRIGWHLGNRHLPTEIRQGLLRIRPDHVIEAMVEALGGTVTRRQAPFQPEGGAYGGHAHHGQSGGGHHHHHSHHHAHGTGAHGAEAHAHAHSHGESHGESHTHVASTTTVFHTHGQSRADANGRDGDHER